MKRPTPVATPPRLRPATAVAAGGSHTIAVTPVSGNVVRIWQPGLDK